MRPARRESDRSELPLYNGMHMATEYPNALEFPGLPLRETEPKV
jgi:hypothetical protein